MFHNTKLERLTSDKHSNLLGQFLIYEENEVLWIHTQRLELDLVNETTRFFTFLLIIEGTTEKVV